MERLTKEQALDLIKNADLKELGRLASARKKELHPKGITTFVVDRILIIQISVGWIVSFVPFIDMRKMLRRMSLPLMKLMRR